MSNQELMIHEVQSRDENSQGKIASLAGHGAAGLWEEKTNVMLEGTVRI